jgi:hypothetical protein
MLPPPQTSVICADELGRPVTLDQLISWLEPETATTNTAPTTDGDGPHRRMPTSSTAGDSPRHTS